MFTLSVFPGLFTSAVAVGGCDGGPPERTSDDVSLSNHLEAPPRPSSTWSNHTAADLQQAACSTDDRQSQPLKVQHLLMILVSVSLSRQSDAWRLAGALGPRSSIE